MGTGFITVRAKMPPIDRIHHLLEARAAHAPDAIALADTGTGALTYAQLLDAARTAARQLGEAGLEPGHRLMLVCENCNALAVLLMAASMCNAWSVPVNARLSAEEITRISAHARPAVTIYTHQISPPADAHAEAADASPTTLAGFNLKIAHHHGTIPEPVEPSAEYQVATLLYTTGTTGDPKGVMLTHGNLIYGGTESARHRGITAEDHLYAVLPLTHVFGLASALMAVIAAGATTELVARFDKAATLEALKERVSIFPAVPQLHAMLMAHAREQGLDTLPTRRLKYISSGGAPLDLEWKNKVEAFFGLQMCNGYGLTETTAGIAATRPGSPRDDTSVGPPLDGSLVRIDHPNDDGIGEIAVHGPAVMKGYYRNPEETAKVLSADGWFSTGDLGFIDAAGNLHVTGRKKELIIRSGFNVYPLEVEAALNQHPDVVHAAVIGVPRDGNEEIVAFVHPATGTSLTPDTLKAHLQDRLAPYKHPTRYVFSQDLPAAPSGKILKAKLAETFATEINAIKGNA
jgi:acyl-CoA synthetase (AMP-forming)/AMP-acid ligase II